MKKKDQRLVPSHSIYEKGFIRVDPCFIPANICVTDENGDFVKLKQVYCNFYGYQQEELDGDSYALVVPDDWKQETQELPHRLKGKKEELQDKQDVTDREGTLIGTSSCAANVPATEYNDSCKMTFVVEVDQPQNTLQSVKDTVKILDEKLNAQEVAQQLTNHDLRNNIASIYQIAELLLDTQPTKEQKFWLNHLKEQSSKALDMFRATLDYAKMERGIYEPQITKFDLVETIKVELNRHSKTIEDQQVEVALEYQQKPLGEHPIQVEADKFYIERVFHNLLLNALEATPEHQVIKVSLEHSEFFKITIHNQGVIPWELRENFFDKFATSGKSKGTGLGTYIAKLVVEMHQGRITYRSREDYGTEIVILFPRSMLLQ